MFGPRASTNRVHGLRSSEDPLLHGGPRVATIATMSLWAPETPRKTGTPDGSSGPASEHERKVSRVAQELRGRPSGQPASFKKKAVGHQVPKGGDLRHTDRKIDLTDLDAILAIDPEAMTCTAEPGVTFDELVAATMRVGLLPLVVPELRTITIGGAVSGCSLESMSFRHGGFHDTCLEYEVITAQGRVLHCTPDNEHRLVFHMMHGSFGTLGVLAKLKFRLVRAKPFVRMTYDTYSTLEDYKAAIWRHYVEMDVDFMDGIIHTSDRYVLSLGRFVDRAPYTNRYDWLKVYYRSTATRREDYLAVEDYVFRYDNGVTNVHPKSFLGRLVFGKFMHSTEVLRIAERLHPLLRSESPDVTVDLLIPFSRLDAFLRWHEDVLGFFPLWCVPYRVAHRYEWLSPNAFEGVDDELYVDLAIYGLKQAPGRNFYKEIEEELARVKGVKTLISYNYYDRETFWQTWNRPNYDRVKRITDPDNLFRDLYSKTCRAARGLKDHEDP